MRNRVFRCKWGLLDLFINYKQIYARQGIKEPKISDRFCTQINHQYDMHVNAVHGGLFILILVSSWKSPGGNMRFESAHFKLSHEMTQLLDPSGVMKSETWEHFVR